MKDYTELITSEHRDKPKYLQFVELLTQAFGQISDVARQLALLYDVDTATGIALDRIGLWVGVSRRVNVPITGVFFSFDTAGVGWDQGVWKNPYQSAEGVTILDDRTYRAVLKATIVANYWSGTVEDVQRWGATALQEFNLYVAVIDNFDMSYDILVIGQPPAPLLALLRRGVFPPKTAGVRLRNVIVYGHTIFGLDLENSIIAGLDEGYFL